MSFGDFLRDAIVVGGAALLGGPVLAGAVAGGLIGGRREDQRWSTRGALLGGVIAAGFTEAGLFEGSATAETLGTEAATAETLTSGGAAATTAAAAPEAASTTAELAQGTLAGAEPAAVAADASTTGISQFAGGAADLPGALRAAPPAGGGIINSGLEFVKANPLASVLGVQAVGGIGKSIADRKAAEERLRAEQELLAARRRLAPSTGGVGVNLNMRPGDPILRRPDGRPVFAPGGIIASSMR